MLIAGPMPMWLVVIVTRPVPSLNLVLLITNCLLFNVTINVNDIVGGLFCGKWTECASANKRDTIFPR